MQWFQHNSNNAMHAISHARSDQVSGWIEKEFLKTKQKATIE
jgi:hypothetical protein